MGAAEINVLDPFRDDPPSKVPVPEVVEGQTLAEPLPKLEEFCSCGRCTVMKSKDECFCCKSMNYFQIAAS